MKQNKVLNSNLNMQMFKFVPKDEIYRSENIFEVKKTLLLIHITCMDHVHLPISETQANFL